jgi:hypothetical protein
VLSPFDLPRRGVIVENQLDRRVGRTVGIEQFGDFDELAAAVAVPDQGMDFAGDQIDPSQNFGNLWHSSCRHSASEPDEHTV